MSEFKVGDRVRIKDDAEADGWLRPGEVGEITSIEIGAMGNGQCLNFEGISSSLTPSLYYGYEVEPYVEPEPVDHSVAIDALRDAIAFHENGGALLEDVDRVIADLEQRLAAARGRALERADAIAALKASIAHLKGESGAAG